MRLFDDKIKRVSRPAKYSESHYRYLNISSKPEFVIMRKELEKWFQKYPDREKFEFSKRFRNNDNDQFLSSFYELFLHELCLRLKYKVQVHPDIDSNNKHPDFLIINNIGDEFYLEVATCSIFTKEEKYIYLPIKYGFQKLVILDYLVEY